MFTTVPDRKLGYGLIGYGAWGAHHARAAAANASIKLAAIAFHSPASRDRAATDHPGVALLSDYHELLARPDIEVVDIVLPSDLHHEVALASLQAGKHVMLEKPMALRLDHCAELIRVAQERKLMLSIGHEFRLSSLWGRIRRMIDEGAIGQPRYALVELWRNPYRQGSGGWRYDRSRVGNWILEEPIHFFDLARWYFTGSGDPVSVFAKSSCRDLTQPELADNFSALLSFPDGAYAVISQTLAAFEHHQCVKVTGTKGALWATWSGALDRTFHPAFSLKYFDGRSIVDVPITKITGEVYELEDQIEVVARHLLDGTPLSCSGHDGFWSAKMCLAAQKSVDTGLPVDLAHF